MLRTLRGSQGQSGCAMSVVSGGIRLMNRQLAGALTGRVSKWIVLVAWLLLFGGSFVFAAKLADVQNSEASSWLPESAESTRAFEKLEPFQDPNALATVVVYEKTEGLTEEDLAAARE